jgi:UDP-N-acetylmuramate--alanine ligase
VTNVEADHLDHWVTAEAVHQAFNAFVERVDRDGVVVVCLDDPGSVAVGRFAEGTGRTVRTYGESDQADVQVTGVSHSSAGSSFVPIVDGESCPPVDLQMVGRHNVLNAAAALAAGIELGFAVPSLIDGLQLYTGARRRFEFKGEADSVRVYDDYAHHHSELRATLVAARQISGEGRLVVAFQPLRFTRTAQFHRELGAALGLADEVVVLEVYGSNEEPIPGATGALVAAAVPLDEAQVTFEPSFSAVPRWLVDRARPGDLVLTLGDGIVATLGPEVIEQLRDREKQGRK